MKSQQRPASVTAATWLLGALIALTGVAAVLALVFEDEFVDAWAAGIEDGSTVETPSIMPVVVVMLIVVGALALVLLEFFRVRHAWARSVITSTLVLLAIGTISLLRVGPPALFVVLSVISLVLDAAVIVALWHRDTSAYLKAAVRPDEISA